MKRLDKRVVCSEATATVFVSDVSTKRNFNTILNSRGNQPGGFTRLVSFSATLGAMAMGTILGWSSPAQDMLSRGQLPFPVNAHDALTYSSALGIGAVAGAMHAGAVSRAIGRRYGMILYEMFVVSGWACLTVPAAAWTLTAGRVLQGVGVGALCTIIPAYVGEISQPDVRGEWSTTHHTRTRTGWPTGTRRF